MAKAIYGNLYLIRKDSVFLLHPALFFWNPGFHKLSAGLVKERANFRELD